MTAALQGCALQGSLWDVGEEAGLRGLGRSVRRTVLSHGAWLDLRPGWATGSDALFARLDRGRAVARRAPADVRPDGRRARGCSASTARATRCPTRCSCRPATTSSRHYAAELGEPFVTAGLCLYRDGRDSVAWHGDTIGRSRTEDTMVAILSLGSPRALLLRPARRRADAAAPARPRRPRGDGRLLPAHVGARHPQDGPAGGPADQRAVPHPRGPVATRRLSCPRVGHRRPAAVNGPVSRARPG